MCGKTTVAWVWLWAMGLVVWLGGGWLGCAADCWWLLARQGACCVECCSTCSWKRALRSLLLATCLPAADCPWSRSGHSTHAGPGRRAPTLRVWLTSTARYGGAWVPEQFVLLTEPVILIFYPLPLLATPTVVRKWDGQCGDGLGC